MAAHHPSQDEAVGRTVMSKAEEEMSALLDDAMKVFQAYVNVPEANAVRDRWMKLKSEREHQTPSNQAAPTE